MAYRRKTDARGLIEYGTVSASYGEKVRLQESSAAISSHCWLYVDSAKNKNDLEGGERVEVSAHLNFTQAMQLRDMLNEWLEDNEDT